MIIKVGEPYPYHHRADGNERVLAEMNNAFFDVLFYSSQPQADARMWTKGKLKYGLFMAKNIPFFVLDFPSDQFNLDVAINFLKIQEDKADEWLNSDANVINLFLIDANTNIIHGMRMISIRHDLAEKIRDACEAQDVHYDSPAQVDQTIAGITERYTTNNMIKISQMYHGGN